MPAKHVHRFDWLMPCNLYLYASLLPTDWGVCMYGSNTLQSAMLVHQPKKRTRAGMYGFHICIVLRIYSARASMHGWSWVGWAAAKYST